MLHTEPSFCIYANEDAGLVENQKGDSSVTSSQAIDSTCEFSFADRNMGLIAEHEHEHDHDQSSGFNDLGGEEKTMKDNEQIEPLSPKMYLATGFGIDVMGGDKSSDVEEYYKMMISEDPCNPMYLKNYAQFLQSKGDLSEAEDYYLRATAEDPKDGEILMEYAKLVWELHRDQDRALSYFEKATHAAPGDCNILAAYASFLWEIDQVQDEDYDHGGLTKKTLEEQGTVLGANVASLSTNENTEEHSLSSTS